MLVIRWSAEPQSELSAADAPPPTPAAAPLSNGLAATWSAACDHLRPGARKTVCVAGRFEAVAYSGAGLNPVLVEEPRLGVLIAVGTPSRGDRLIPSEATVRAWLRTVAQAATPAEGLRTLTDCEGFYWFAYHDLRTDALTVLTDRIGMVPLYRAEHDGVVWFSTSATALACLRPTGWDTTGWSCVLVAGYPLRDVSLYQGIQRVGAGMLLSCSPAGTRTERWWRPPWDRKIDTTAASIAREYVRERRTTLAARLGGLPRVYATLSGGLDSRCALALVRGIQPNLEVFTGQTADDVDRVGAAMVAQALALRWRVLEDTWLAPETLRTTLLSAALAADGEQNPFSSSVLWAERLRHENAVVMWGLGGEVLRDYWSAHERVRWLLKGADRLERLMRYRMSGAHLPLATVNEHTRRTASGHVRELLAASDRELADLPPLERSEALYLTERVRRWAGPLVWKTAEYTVPELPLLGQQVVELAPRWPLAARRDGAILRWAIELADPAAARLPHNGGYPTRPRELASPGERLRGTWLDGRRLARRLFHRRAELVASAHPTYRTLFEDLLQWSNMRSAALYDEQAFHDLLTTELDRPARPESPLNIVIGTEWVCRATRLRPDA